MPTTDAQTIIDRASYELGFASSSLTPGQIQQVGLQSLALMNTLGDELTREHDWQFLEKVETINCDGVTTQFQLPADFGRIVNQTQWTSSMKLPMIGPLNAQQWGWTQYGIVGTGIYYRYRILDNQFTVFPAPGAGDTIHFYYISKNWVRDGITQQLTDTLIQGLDEPLFDRALMIKGLKVRIWGQHGFDTTQLSLEFRDEIQYQNAQNQGAPEIRLSRGMYDGYLINGWTNVTDGSW